MHLKQNNLLIQCLKYTISAAANSKQPRSAFSLVHEQITTNQSDLSPYSHYTLRSTT